MTKDMHMTIGTKERPLSSEEPMKIGREALYTIFRTAGDKQGLVWRQEGFWQWYGGRWIQRTNKEVEDQLWHWLEDAWVTDPDPERSGCKRYGPTKMGIEQVRRALEAITATPVRAAPFWIDPIGKPKFDSRYVWAFQDVLVDVKASAEKGEWVTYKRDEVWFDPVILPCAFNPEAECPTWMKTVEIWGEGDPVWTERLERTLGSLVNPARVWGKWFLFFGKPRAGKGVCTRLLNKAIGYPGFYGTDMRSMSGGFGLAGIESARVWSIAEVHDMEKGDGDTVASIVKRIVGQDPLSVNRKYKDATANVIAPAGVLMQSNEIPRLPNKGRGMSSKMVPIVFSLSFENKEDTELEDRLEAELPGILLRWIKACIRLVQERDAAKRFPLDEKGREAISLYNAHNSPMDSMLEEMFVENVDGFVELETVWKIVKAWERKVGIPIRIAYNQLGLRLEKESGWGIRRGRASNCDRGLWGLSLGEEGLKALAEMPQPPRKAVPHEAEMDSEGADWPSGEDDQPNLPKERGSSTHS
jgi:putative DNA primase/helicase